MAFELSLKKVFEMSGRIDHIAPVYVRRHGFDYHGIELIMNHRYKESEHFVIPLDMILPKAKEMRQGFGTVPKKEIAKIDAKIQGFEKQIKKLNPEKEDLLIKKLQKTVQIYNEKKKQWEAYSNSEHADYSMLKGHKVRVEIFK